MQAGLSWSEGACDQERLGSRVIFAPNEKPVSSQEIVCMDDCLVVKELASNEDVEFFFSKDKNSLSQF
eukprot:13947144-Ditylum_brightwellii.AAC.1